MKLIATLLSALLLHTAVFAGDDYDMKNQRTPEGNIVTGGQPSLADINRMKLDGISTIINMRAPGEYDQGDIKNAALAAGIKYVELPISSADAINEKNAWELNALLKEATDGKTLVHCGSGNRVGALMALKAYHVDGKSKAAAIAYGESAGLTRLKPVVEAALPK